MTYPPLPEPEIVDGRRLYAAGQMREYGKQCHALACKPAPAAQSSQKKQDINEGVSGYSSALADLMSLIRKTK